MKNKKGYTVVELLATLLIIGLLLLIGIPTIRKYINRGTSAYYTAIEKEMKVAGSEYLNTYRTLLPRVIGHSTVISLEEVVANNYIDPVVDENGNECTGQIMAVKRKKDGYDYHACLRCGNRYVSKDDNCKVSDTSDTGFENNELDNTYEDSANYRIVFDQYEYEVEQTQEFVLPTGRVEHLENGEWKEINAEPVVSTKKVDTNSLGTKTVIYSYHGSKTEIKVNIIDKVAPSKPEVVIKYESANGNNYQGNWYSGKLYVEYKSTDYTKKNVLGSGIKNYEYSLDGDNWIEVRKDNDSNKEFTDWNIIDANATSNKIIPGDGEYTIKVRAIDKNNNVSEVNVYTVKIDTKAPDCALVVSGDIGLENWYKSGITVTYDLTRISGTTSNILTTPIVATRANGTVITTGTSSVTINTPEENIRVYGTITDEAGNVTVCEAPALDGGYRLKLDPRVPDAPVITVTDGNGVNGRWYTGNNPSNVDEYVTSPNTNVWHINDTTMTFSGANNLSKNIYFYTIDSDVAIDSTGRATNATNGEGFDVRNVAPADIKAVQSNNTSGTTYYAKVCSVAGNCSASSNYIVKLDKTTPSAPTFTAVDSKPLGDLWHVDATNTSTTPVSGVWHIVDTTLNLSGASNISGNIYHYAASTALTANQYARPNGSRGTTTGAITSNTPTAGTTYYGMVCSVAGRCSGNSNFLLKIDKTTPSAPTMTAHDNKASGAWHNKADTDSNGGNVTISFSGANNVSGNIYWYKANSAPTESLGRMSDGTRGNFNHGTNTEGITYYGKVCSVAGRCSSGSGNYVVRLDKTNPSVSLNSITSSDTRYNTRTVTVNVTSSDNYSTKQICLMTSNTTSGCTWTNTDGNLTTQYTFPAGEGTGTAYTLYAFVKDVSGNIVSSTKAYTLYTRCTVKTETGRGSWGGCSASCDGGTQSKPIYYVDTYLGGSCPNGAETQSCNTQGCCSSTHRSEGSWGACSASCGGGTQYRSYSNISDYDGRTCSSGTDSQACNTQGCCTNVHGGNCGSWGTCTSRCGTGYHTRECRAISNYTGQDCGGYIESEGCSDYSGCAPQPTANPCAGCRCLNGVAVGCGSCPNQPC